jgi:hypothetical protein
MLNRISLTNPENLDKSRLYHILFLKKCDKSIKILISKNLTDNKISHNILNSVTLHQ